MSEKDDTLEEICLGHLLNSIKKDGDPGDFKAGDLKVLKSLYGWSHSGCDKCECDEWNRNCPFYKPIKIHKYNVLPKEEPKKTD